MPTTQPAYCTVPKLKKKSVAQATAALTAAGCKIGKVTKHHSRKHQKGKVLAQAVVAGIQVKLGTAVDITIGK
jgi:beta-lactam-binding protein with PASTA domain